MNGVLWYVLTSTRGGSNRIRILREIDEKPKNANKLADELNLDYTTVRYHLDVLTENDILKEAGDGYGSVYILTERAKKNSETIDEIVNESNITHGEEKRERLEEVND